ncbi:MAG: hypothetical protein WDN45_02945 [Caulobacteraceae bacterium]
MRVMLALLFVMAAGPALAQAQGPAPPKEPPPQVDPVTTIARIDTDHDGAASREEWVAYGNHDAGFTAIDADHDGRLTVAELRVFRAAQAKTDEDRARLKAENPRFDPQITILMADTNRDGAVSEQEWVAYGGPRRRRIRPDRRQPRRQDHGGGTAGLSGSASAEVAAAGLQLTEL